MHNREIFSELERGVHAALETYSTIQSGSGRNSLVSGTCWMDDFIRIAAKRVYA